MKKISLILALLLLFAGYGYALTPPTVVKNAFEKKFPNATKVKWGKETKTVWEADFVNKGTKMSSNFSQNGDWVETEIPIKISELPKAVFDALQKKYHNWKIIEVDRTETAKNGVIFEVDVKSGSHKKGVAFKEDGTEVKE